MAKDNKISFSTELGHAEGVIEWTIKDWKQVKIM